MANVIVQYILVRKDLTKSLAWPAGAVIAQACHACSAIMHLHKEDTEVKLYFEELDRMHKIILGVRNRLMHC